MSQLARYLPLACALVAAGWCSAILVGGCQRDATGAPEVTTDEALGAAREALDERDWEHAIQLAELALDAGVEAASANALIERARAEIDNLARYEQAKALFEADQFDKAYGKLASISLDTVYATRAQNLLMRIQQAVALPEVIRRPGEALMRRVLVGTFRRGSSTQEVERAMSLCESVAGHCRKEWFWRETPREWVTLGSFYLDETEVTVEQYARCVTTGTCDAVDLKGCGVDADDVAQYALDQLPQVCVTWTQAAAYCGSVGARLPTEAEWEKAAKGPRQTRFPWGDTWEPSRANWSAPNAEDGFAQLAPVGRFGPFGFGLYDMAGNAYEWVSDRYADHYPKGAQVNPLGPKDGSSRGIRGGALDRGPSELRAAHRNRMPEALADKTVGFRCAKDPVGLGMWHTARFPAARAEPVVQP